MTALLEPRQGIKRKRTEPSEFSKSTKPTSRETSRAHEDKAAVTKARKESKNEDRKTKKLKLDPKEEAHEPKEEPSGTTDDQNGKSQRFIVFIGNLPFTATTEAITKHFAVVKPISVRHITHKDDPSRSKGFAFLEFAHYDRMKTCLKLFQHSSFQDGQSPARKLNVELTAGGGGSKSKERKKKLRVKNERLKEQRSRRAQEEARQRAINAEDEGKGDAEIVHPSRRARVALD